MNIRELSTKCGGSWTLCRRLNFLLALLTALLALGWAYRELATARLIIHEDSALANRITVQLLGVLIQEWRAAEQRPTPQALVRFLEQAGSMRSHEILWLDGTGQVRYRTPRLANHLVTGEVRPVPEWFAHYVARDLSPVTLEMENGSIQLTPDMRGSMANVWSELVTTLWLTLGFVLLVDLILFWAVGRLLAPLRQLVRGLQGLQSLDYATRLPPQSSLELNTLFQAFNRMAQALQENVQLRGQAQQSRQQLMENRALTALIQSHVEEERRTLARELHDELGQMLTAVCSIATAVQRQCTPAQPELARRVQAIVDLGAQMYAAMHRLVRQLRPPALDELGLDAALSDLVSTTNLAQSTLQVTLQTPREPVQAEAAVLITVYRLVQEALNNTLRHARARRVSILVRCEEKGDSPRLGVVVQDDGQGCDLTSVGNGRFGLRGMRERIQALEGEFSVFSQPGQGFRLELSLPLGRPAGPPQEPSAASGLDLEGESE